MKLNLQSFGHFALLRVSESVSPDQFPVLKAGILKISQHDRIVGRNAVALDVTAVDAAIASDKALAQAMVGLGPWASETGVFLLIVSAIPGLGQVPDSIQARTRLESPAGRQQLADFIAERESKGLAEQVEKGGKQIEQHQALRKQAASNRGRAHQLAARVRDVWKDRKPGFELGPHQKRMGYLFELIEKVPRK